MHLNGCVTKLIVFHAPGLLYSWINFDLDINQIYIVENTTYIVMDEGCPVTSSIYYEYKHTNITTNVG